MPDFGIMRGFNEKLFGDKLYAGQLPTQLGLIGSQEVSDFLLDVYPNAAAAYSLRKLRTLYAGSAIRVRRTDLAETNIGFTSAGNLDTTALLAFVGTGASDNGFVTTWYDQSGNGNNATQTTALNQPQIVSSGVFLGYLKNISNGFLTTSAIIPANTTWSNFHVASNAGPAVGGVIGSTTGISNYYLVSQNGSSADSYQGTSNLSYFANGNSIGLTRNNVYNATISMTVLSVFGEIISQQSIALGYSGFNGVFRKEYIFYMGDKSVNRIAIESNINAYYGIY